MVLVRKISIQLPVQTKRGTGILYHLVSKYPNIVEQLCPSFLLGYKHIFFARILRV